VRLNGKILTLKEKREGGRGRLRGKARARSKGGGSTANRGGGEVTIPASREGLMKNLGPLDLGGINFYRDEEK